MWKWVFILFDAILVGFLEGCIARRHYHLSAKAVLWYPVELAGGAMLLFWQCGLSLRFLWGVAFALVASYFATEDILRRTVSDWMHILIFLLGCFRLSGETWKSMAVGLFACSVPMLLVTLIKSGSIGGADIKCMAAIGWALGWDGGFCALLLGCVLSLLGSLLTALIRREKIRSAPMVPYFCAAALLTYSIM